MSTTRRLLIDIAVDAPDEPISEHVKALLLAHVARIDAGRDTKRKAPAAEIAHALIG